MRPNPIEIAARAALVGVVVFNGLAAAAGLPVSRAAERLARELEKRIG